MTTSLPNPTVSKLSWLAVSCLFLAYILSVVNQFNLDLSLLEYRLDTPIAKEMPNEQGRSDSPDLLTYQASSLARKGYQLKQQGAVKQDYQPWFESAIALAKQASQLKPMDGEPYRQLANAYWNLGSNAQVIGHYIAKLQSTEPFERSTIFDSLKYYLSFWEQLSVSERKQAIAYLYDTKKYGIYYELIGSQLDNQELRKKACQIYAFSHKKISFCMKEFVELYY